MADLTLPPKPWNIEKYSGSGSGSKIFWSGRVAGTRRCLETTCVSISHCSPWHRLTESFSNKKCNSGRFQLHEKFPIPETQQCQMDVCFLAQQSMQLLGCAGDQGWIIRSLCSDGPINPAGYRMIWLAQVAQKLLIRPNLRSQGWQLISESWNWLCVQYVTIWIESKFARSHFQPERIISEVELKVAIE